MGLPRDVFASLCMASRNFDFCLLHEKDGITFDPWDKAALCNQLDLLMRDVDKRWVGGRFYSEPNFRGYPVVQKYLKAIQFAPGGGFATPRRVRIELALPETKKAPKAA